MGEPLAGEDAYAMIGTVVGRAEGIVSRRDFQRWAAAVGETNPLYFDADYARAQGYRDVIAPPLYVSYVTLGVTRLDELRPDGTPDDSATGLVPLPRCPRLMAGGQEVTVHEPLYDGDVVDAVTTITGVSEKSGRSGPFVLVTSVTSYRCRDGRTVAEVVDTVLARP